MPTRQYTARHEPPRLIDRYLSHVWQANFAILTAIAGALLITDAVIDQWSVSPSVGALPPWLAASLGVLQLTGGAMCAWAILPPRQWASTTWRMTETGWLLASPGWITYALMVIAAFPGSVLAWAASLTIGFSGLLQVGITRIVETTTREVGGGEAGGTAEDDRI